MLVILSFYESVCVIMAKCAPGFCYCSRNCDRSGFKQFSDVYTSVCFARCSHTTLQVCSFHFFMPLARFGIPAGVIPTQKAVSSLLVLERLKTNHHQCGERLPVPSKGRPYEGVTVKFIGESK